MRCQNIVSRRKDAVLLLVLSNQHSKSRIYSIYYSKRQWKAVIKTEFMSFVHQVIISSNISNHFCSVFHFFSFPNRRCFVVKRLHTVCYFFLNLKAIRRQQPAKTQWIYYLAILQHSRTLCCRSTFCSNVSAGIHCECCGVTTAVVCCEIEGNKLFRATSQAKMRWHSGILWGIPLENSKLISWEETFLLLYVNGDVLVWGMRHLKAVCTVYHRHIVYFMEAQIKTDHHINT